MIKKPILILILVALMPSGAFAVCDSNDMAIDATTDEKVGCRCYMENNTVGITRVVQWGDKIFGPYPEMKKCVDLRFRWNSSVNNPDLARVMCFGYTYKDLLKDNIRPVPDQGNRCWKWECKPGFTKSGDTCKIAASPEEIFAKCKQKNPVLCKELGDCMEFEDTCVASCPRQNPTDCGAGKNCVVLNGLCMPLCVVREAAQTENSDTTFTEIRF